MLKKLLFKSASSDSTNLEIFSKLIASDGAAGDYFGTSASISSDGGYVVIGAHQDDDKGNNSGSAYVFAKQENGQYTQTQKLSASDGAVNDYFGNAVSISGDGGAIVIGAYRDADKGVYTGSAYVFTRQENGQYTQSQKLTASDGAAYDNFGYSVSISDDGGVIVIGAYSKGSVYLFTRQENGQYTQTQKLVGAANGWFGHSVSISGDGGVIAIGAHNTNNKGTNSGSAYIFTRQTNGLYTQTQNLTASDGAAYDWFGYSVSISGDGGSIVIGAHQDDDKGSNSGSAYLFTKQENGQYTQTQKLVASDGAANDYFGRAVSISGDGGSVVIGAYGDADKGVNTGSAYVFTRQENEQYTQTQKLVASDSAANDYFGYSVSISGDGGTIVIGAYGKDTSGSAYFFK